MAIPLSVLDLAHVAQGATSADALQRCVSLAQRLDTGAFTRFWVAEHHNMASVASTTPPVIIAAIAAQTQNLRVGSGGVMLPNHAPYVVAEQFAALEALYPNRIDLGIGRAPGTDQFTARALRRDAGQLGVDEFPQHVLEVMSWLGDNRLEEPLSARLLATPNAETYPEVWLLGSSGYAAQLAGVLGVRYCYAHHFGQMDPVQVMDAYRSRFQPSPALDEPYGMVCTSVVTGETEEEADYLAGPARMMALGMARNQRNPIMPPEAAAQHEFNALELDMLKQLPAPKFVGTPERVVDELRTLAEVCGVQELMLTGVTYAMEHKARSLESVQERW